MLQQTSHHIPHVHDKLLLLYTDDVAGWGVSHLDSDKVWISDLKYAIILTKASSPTLSYF